LGHAATRGRALGAHRAPLQRRVRAAASAVGPEILAACDDDKDPRTSGLARVLRTTEALWNFTRPHTLIGSALCIPALHLFAAPVGVALPWARLATSISFVMIPSLFINIYITGLNQVLDIEADKINKPYLPLAKGEFTKNQGIAICVVCLILGLGIGFSAPAQLTSMPLRATLLGSTVLGTAYSLPPLRLKRFPLMAGICITTVRGALVNWGFFSHATTAVFDLGQPGASDAFRAAAAFRCACATSFFLLFGVVIALLKDIPDVAGDRAVGISTFSLQFGREKVFAVATGVLQFAFAAVGLGLGGAALRAVAQGGSAALVGALPRLLGGVLALSFAAAVRVLARSVKVEVPDEVYAFYMKCWGLFYASYAWLPLAR